MAKYAYSIAHEVLSRDKRTNKELSAILDGLSVGYISDVRTAKKMPSPAMRDRFAAALGIAPHMWDMPVEKQPALVAPKPPVATTAQPAQTKQQVTTAVQDARQATTLEQLDALLTTVRQQQVACADDKMLKSWLDAERQILVQRAKYEEMLLEVHENFAASPYFQSFWKVVLDALAPFPDALAAVSEAVRT